MLEMLKFLLIFILVSILVSWVFRAMVTYAAKKFVNNFSQQNQDGYQSRNRKEGDVHIRQTPRDKKIDKDVGEYVDYEEIN